MKKLLYKLTLSLFAIILNVEASQAAEPDTYNIGAILILSGNASNYGFYSQRGANLALDEINAAGGIKGKPLRIIYEDESGGKAMPALSAYRKLTKQDGVKFILGPNFQDALAALAPIAERDKVFLVTPSCTTSETAPSFVFSTWPNAEHESETIAKRIFIRSKRLAILGEQQAWSSIVDAQVIKTFRELGGEIVAHEAPAPQATDVRSEILRVKAASPDAILISGYNLFGLYAKEIQRVGLAVTIFGIELDQSAIDSAGGSAENLIYIGPSMPNSQFVKKYSSKFSSPPDLPASNSYDAVHMLSSAIAQVGDDPEAVANYFREIKEYQGSSGTIARAGGRTKLSLSFYSVKNGKIVRVP